ncbi:MAG TPA: PAS domain S-box protein [Flavobacterium sp.]|jgi:PAS domain S-box-containing protein|nr:PAS domain S-box protein [Flavobacterium sp.]
MNPLGQTFTILVIEDNIGDFVLIEEYLNDSFQSPTVVHTQTCTGASEILTSGDDLDVILLDLTLPDSHGEVLLTSIKKLSGDVPIIVLTGFNNKEFGFKSLSFGVSDYLLKDELTSSQLYKSITYSIERQKFNRKLQESEEKYKTLFQLSPIPKWIYDWETLQFLYVNDAAIRHYGYSKEEFLSMTIKDIRFPEDYPALEAALNQRCEGSTQFYTTNIFRHVKKNGEAVDVEVQSSAIEFMGRSARLVLAADVTHRLRAEHAILTSEKRFKALVQESGDLISIVDSDGQFLYATPNHETVLGISETSLIGKNIRAVMHHDDVGTIDNFLQTLGSSKRAYSNPYRIIDGKDNIVWMESIGTNANDDPAVNGIVINSRDVTTRVENERKIQEINQRFEAIAKATSDVIYDYDLLTDNISLTGSNYHSLYGYSFEGNSTNLDFFKMGLHPDEKETVYTFFNKAIQDPDNTHFELEYKFLKRDGTYAVILDRFDIIWQNGIPIKKIGALQDISTKKFQETVLALEKEIYELNANPNITFDFVINKLVTNIETLMPESLCTISLLNDDQTIVHIAGNAADNEFLKSFDGMKIGPAAGSSGTAMYTGKKVIVSDIATSPLWEDYAAKALDYGLRACWSVPVKKSTGNVIASFSTYYKNIREPKQDDINLVERVASLVGVLVENRNAFIETERAKERYDIVAKATSDTIWDWNIQDDIFVWNKGIQGIFGYAKEDVGNTSKWWFDRIHPEDSIKMSVKLYSFLEQKTEKWQDEYRFACADGTFKYVFDRGFLVKDANGKAIRMIGAMQDVTRQKEEEQRLKLLETVITQTKDSVIITESEKSGNTIPKIVFVNPAFSEMTGYQPEDVIGQTPTIFMDKRSFKNDFERFSSALKNKQEFKFETLNNKKNGEEYWVNFSMIPITNKEGEHSHWISIQRDITEEKKQEKEKEQLIRELTQNNKDLKQFSYITSHNLRAPLSNLTGLLNLIEDIPVENYELKEILDGFSKSTHLLNETINDLVKVVIIKDSPSIQKEEVLIKDVFDNVYSQLTLLINLHKLDINVELEKVSILNINKAYLESILLNLLTNAIKYRSTTRQLKISVCSKVVGDSIELIFKDNGIGIDMERNKDKIFGLYQRFHNYPDSKGLGLYLVKSQVESMGGTIAVESVVDQGTTFTLTFKKQTN